MKIASYGHACFSVNVGGKTLLFDPFITPNPLAAAIDIGSLKPDYILLSHGHDDHVAEVEVIAKPPDKRSARPEAMFEIENVSVWGEITVPKSRVYTPLEPVNVPPPPVCESLATA